jgi:hypothetical protein
MADFQEQILVIPAVANTDDFGYFGSRARQQN